MVAHLNGVQEVGGSNPLAPTRVLKSSHRIVLRELFAPNTHDSVVGLYSFRTLLASNTACIKHCLSRTPSVSNTVCSQLTMNSQVANSPGLLPSDLELLRKVEAGLRITADVSRADVLLCTPLSKEKAIVAFHAIPNSISSLYRKDASGRILNAEIGRAHV